MRILEFKGLIPKVSPRVLPRGKAVVARNLDIYGNHLRPLRQLQDTLRQLVSVDGKPFRGKAETIYRAGEVFVAWDKKVWVATDWTEKLGVDTFLFVEGGKLYRQSPNRVLRQEPPIQVGICRPDYKTTQITLEVADEQGCEKERIQPLCVPSTGDCDNVPHPPVPVAYLFTYVNKCGEESANSSPSELLDVQWGDAVIVRVSDTPPANAIKRRWYRVVSDNNGVGRWLLVGEQPIGQREFYDMNCPCDFSSELMTEDHDCPPDCLEGVINIGNNITLVWSNHRFWLSENNFPHAYNINNEYRLRYRIMGMFEHTPKNEGAVHYSVLAITEGLHYHISATSPSGPVISEMQNRYKCVNIKGAMRTVDSVIYPAKQGIILLGPEQEELITGELMTEHEWAEYDPYTVRLAYYDDRIFGFTADGGFILQLGRDSRRDTDFVEHNIVVDNVFVDEITPMLLSKGSKLYDWAKGDFLTYRWRSAPLVMDGEWRPVAVKVVSPEFAEVKSAKLREVWQKYKDWHKANPYRDDPQFIYTHPEYNEYYGLLLQHRPSVKITLYADGEKYYSRVVQSAKPFLLPRRYKAIDWQVELEGNVEIYEVHVQTSRESLTKGE